MTNDAEYIKEYIKESAKHDNEIGKPEIHIAIGTCICDVCKIISVEKNIFIEKGEGYRMELKVVYLHESNHVSSEMFMENRNVTGLLLVYFELIRSLDKYCSILKFHSYADIMGIERTFVFVRDYIKSIEVKGKDRILVYSRYGYVHDIRLAPEEIEKEYKNLREYFTERIN